MQSEDQSGRYMLPKLRPPSKLSIRRQQAADLGYVPVPPNIRVSPTLRRPTWANMPSDVLNHFSFMINDDSPSRASDSTNLAHEAAQGAVLLSPIDQQSANSLAKAQVPRVKGVASYPELRREVNYGRPGAAQSHDSKTCW